MDLHDEVMRANGGSWSSPPESVSWNWSHRTALHRVVLEFEGCDCWGFKDPRSLFTLNYWEKIIPQMEFVGIFRSPVAVARSLWTRDVTSFPTLERGIDLWTAYNRRLLEVHARRPFPIVNFDAASDEFAAKLDLVREKLGFVKSGDAGAFFSDDLRHQQGAAEIEIPVETARLYDRLLTLAL